MKNNEIANFYDRCPIPVVIFKKAGKDLTLIYWNPAAVKMTSGHIEKSNTKAKKIFERSGDIIEDLNRCLKTGKSFQTERLYYFQHIDKTAVYIANYNPLPGNMVEVYLIDITKQRNFEERMNLLVNNSDYCMIIFDKKQQVEYLIAPSGMMRATKGVLGKKLDLFMPGEEAETTNSIIRQVFRTGKPASFEARKYQMVGKEIWVSESFYPIPGKAGKISYVGYIAREVTHLVKLEKKLKVTEERYSSIFRKSQNGICYCKFENRSKGKPAGFVILDVNPAFVGIFGSAIEDYINTKGEDVFPVMFKDIMKNRESVLAKKNFVYEWFREDIGKYLKANAFAVHDDDFVIEIEDITDQKKAEEGLLRSEKKYREITDLVRVMILDVDTNYNIVFMNEYAQNRLFPSPGKRDEVINLAEIIDTKDRDKFISGCNDIICGKDTEIKAFHLKHNGGGKIFALSNAVKITSGDKISGVRLAIFELNEIASSIVFPDAELNKRFGLSKRESDVLFSQISGLTDQDIADKLYISKPTVRFHITNLYNKLGVNNKRELYEFMKNNFVRKMGYENLLIYILNSFVRD